jgi:hypothetical protein
MRDTRAFTLSEAVDLYHRVIGSGFDGSPNDRASTAERGEAARFADLDPGGVGLPGAERQPLQS